MIDVFLPAAASRLLLFLIQQFKYTFCRSDRRLNDVGDIRRLRDRHGELARILDERLNVADGDRFSGHECRRPR